MATKIPRHITYPFSLLIHSFSIIAHGKDSSTAFFVSFARNGAPDRTGTNLSDSVGCSPFPPNIVQRFRKYSGYCVIFSYRHKKSTPKGASRIE